MNDAGEKGKDANDNLKDGLNEQENSNDRDAEGTSFSGYVLHEILLK